MIDNLSNLLISNADVNNNPFTFGRVTKRPFIIRAYTFLDHYDKEATVTPCFLVSVTDLRYKMH